MKINVSKKGRTYSSFCCNIKTPMDNSAKTYDNTKSRDLLLKNPNSGARESWISLINRLYYCGVSDL